MILKKWRKKIITGAFFFLRIQQKIISLWARDIKAMGDCFCMIDPTPIVDYFFIAFLWIQIMITHWSPAPVWV